MDGRARGAARSAGAAVADGAAGSRRSTRCVALTWVAAHTSTIRLGTGIIILPQRNPVVLAKEIASLDVLSGGRFTFGVGVGYLEPEFRAIGADFENRGAVTDEFVDAMQHLWYDEQPEFHGRFADFAGVDAHPRPVQQPIPIVVGGYSPRRSGARSRGAHGWYGFALKPDDVAGCLAGLRAAASEVERPAALGPLEITVTPRVADERRHGVRVRRARCRSAHSVSAPRPRRRQRGHRSVRRRRREPLSSSFMSDARDDLGYLELRWAPDDDDVNRLRVRAASAAGFAGSGSGWFNRAPVEAFAARLRAYPLADGDPPELKTGLIEPSDGSYLLRFGIRVYPVGNRGQLGISVELATGAVVGADDAGGRA